MSDVAALLIELGTEELPPKALPELAKSFFDGVCAGLEKRGVPFIGEGARPLYSPRRLAMIVPGVARGQSAQKSEVLGPYLNIGLTAQGQPTPALLGFAARNGLAIEQLEKISDGKGERFVARSVKPGALTSALLPEIINEALKALPVPKPMRWGSREISFVRPVHWLVVLLGDAVVEAKVLGLTSDRMSRGHRFHHDKPVWIASPEDYVDALRSAYVLVDPDERKFKVLQQAQDAAKQRDGCFAFTPESLLDEVNCLVEWPVAIACQFEPAFLAIPREALIATMMQNQKFFPVLDGNNEGKLTERFIGIANIASKDEGQVRKGYERVIRPRFADAQFFYDEDRKQGLAAMAESLKTVTYQQKLGSYADKTTRVATLAELIAEHVGVDKGQARRAAELSKADLQSRLVNEFPELQGIAGRYYASAAGEPEVIADAIDQAYMPRFAGDAIAPSPLGQVLAIAERVDTLAGGFYAGLAPTGNKDPFALRRCALGLARTIVEAKLELDLSLILRSAVMHWPAEAPNTATLVDDEAIDPAQAKYREAENRLLGFILDRLRGYYAEQGFSAAQFDAVSDLDGVVASKLAPAAIRVSSLLDFDRRLRAIGEFARLPDAQALAAANKRIRNILRKTEGAIPGQVDPALLSEVPEQLLNEAITSAINDTDPLLANRDYVAVLTRLAALRAPVDAFFDGVMVMAEDVAVRGNRLALLKRVADRFATVAAVEQLAAG